MSTLGNYVHGSIMGYLDPDQERIRDPKFKDADSTYKALKSNLNTIMKEFHKLQNKEIRQELSRFETQLNLVVQANLE